MQGASGKRADIEYRERLLLGGASDASHSKGTNRAPTPNMARFNEQRRRLLAKCSAHQPLFLSRLWPFWSSSPPSQALTRPLLSVMGRVAEFLIRKHAMVATFVIPTSAPFESAS